MALGYKKILVCIDGSKGSEIALFDSIDIAKRNNAHLDILWVLEMGSLENGNIGINLSGEHIYKKEQECEKQIYKLKRDMINSGLPKDKIDVHLRFGNPKQIIVEDFQPEYHNDLIIVGVNGRHLIKHLIMGSVASHIIRTARCDVLIAKKSEINSHSIKKDIKSIANEN